MGMNTWIDYPCRDVPFKMLRGCRDLIAMLSQMPWLPVAWLTMGNVTFFRAQPTGYHFVTYYSFFLCGERPKRAWPKQNKTNKFEIPATTTQTFLRHYNRRNRSKLHVLCLWCFDPCLGIPEQIFLSVWNMVYVLKLLQLPYSCRFDS